MECGSFLCGCVADGDAREGMGHRRCAGWLMGKAEIAFEGVTNWFDGAFGRCAGLFDSGTVYKIIGTTLHF